MTRSIPIPSHDRILPAFTDSMQDPCRRLSAFRALCPPNFSLVDARHVRLGAEHRVRAVRPTRSSRRISCHRPSERNHHPRRRRRRALGDGALSSASLVTSRPGCTCAAPSERNSRGAAPSAVHRRMSSTSRWSAATKPAAPFADAMLIACSATAIPSDVRPARRSTSVRAVNICQRQ